MKVKYFFIFVLSFLLLVSVVEIFPVHPYANEIFPIYKSSYFMNLEDSFKIISEAFVHLKTRKNPEIAWIFLSKMKKEHGIDFKIYNYQGKRVISPGNYLTKKNRQVLEILSSSRDNLKDDYSKIEGNKYLTFLPMKKKPYCITCHRRKYKNAVIGVIVLSKGFDAFAYYSIERIVLFIFISVFLLFLLIFAVKWIPGKKLKELFDK